MTKEYIIKKQCSKVTFHKTEKLSLERNSQPTKLCVNTIHEHTQKTNHLKFGTWTSRIPKCEEGWSTLLASTFLCSPYVIAENRANNSWRWPWSFDIVLHTTLAYQEFTAQTGTMQIYMKEPITEFRYNTIKFEIAPRWKARQ